MGQLKLGAFVYCLILCTTYYSLITVPSLLPVLTINCPFDTACPFLRLFFMVYVFCTTVWLWWQLTQEMKTRVDVLLSLMWLECVPNSIKVQWLFLLAIWSCPLLSLMTIYYCWRMYKLIIRDDMLKHENQTHDSKPKQSGCILNGWQPYPQSPIVTVTILKQCSPADLTRTAVSFIQTDLSINVLRQTACSS